MTTSPPPPRATCPSAWGVARRVVAALVLLLCATGAGADGPPGALLRVGVYDVPPYGSVAPDGSIGGASVDLWRRVAEALGREYRFVPVSKMEAILEGLERNGFDAAIGAIRSRRSGSCGSISPIPPIARASRSPSRWTAGRSRRSFATAWS